MSSALILSAIAVLATVQAQNTAVQTSTNGMDICSLIYQEGYQDHSCQVLIGGELVTQCYNPICYTCTGNALCPASAPYACGTTNYACYDNHQYTCTNGQLSSIPGGSNVLKLPDICPGSGSPLAGTAPGTSPVTPPSTGAFNVTAAPVVTTAPATAAEVVTATATPVFQTAAPTAAPTQAPTQLVTAAPTTFASGNSESCATNSCSGHESVNGGGPYTLTVVNTQSSAQQFAVFSNQGQSASYGSPQLVFTVPAGATTCVSVPAGLNGRVQRYSGNVLDAATWAEFNFPAAGATGSANQIYYDISVIQGYNGALVMSDCCSSQTAGPSTNLCTAAPSSIKSTDSQGNQVIVPVQPESQGGKTNQAAQNYYDSVVPVGTIFVTSAQEYYTHSIHATQCSSIIVTLDSLC